MNWFLKRVIERARNGDEEFKRIYDTDPEFMGNYFILLFAGDPLPQLDKARNSEFFKTCLRQWQFQELREKTVRNLPVTTEVFKNTAEQIKKAHARHRQNVEHEFLAEADEEGGVTNKDLVAGELRKIGEKANEIADEADAFFKAFQGYGGSETDNETSLPKESLRKIIEHVRRTPMLKGLIEMLGRCIETHRQLVTNKIRRGTMVPHSFSLGADLPLVLPAEFVTRRRARKLFMAGLAEGSLLQEQLGKPESRNRGGIIVVVDETGSMAMDNRIMWAKAIAVAAMLACEKEGRYFAYYPFGWTLGPQRTDPQEIIEMFAQFGDTNIPATIDNMRVLLTPKDKAQSEADILFITDGASQKINPNSAQLFKMFKAEHGMRMLSVVIAGDQSTMIPVSDEVININTNPTQDFEHTVKVFDWLT